MVDTSRPFLIQQVPLLENLLTVTKGKEDVIDEIILKVFENGYPENIQPERYNIYDTIDLYKRYRDGLRNEYEEYKKTSKQIDEQNKSEEIVKKEADQKRTSDAQKRVRDDIDERRKKRQRL